MLKLHTPKWLCVSAQQNIMKLKCCHYVSLLVADAAYYYHFVDICIQPEFVGRMLPHFLCSTMPQYVVFVGVRLYKRRSSHIENAHVYKLAFFVLLLALPSKLESYALSCDIDVQMDEDVL